MPTYDYRCEECGHKMEAFQSMKEDALTRCPACGKDRLRRLIGAGAGIIFKGSGFYETDYKRARTPNGGDKKSDAPSKDGEGSSSKSSESKPTESKSSGSSKSSESKSSESKSD